MSFLQSLFAPPGSSDASAQNGQWVNAGNQASQLMSLLYPGLSQQLSYGNSLIPQQQALTQSYLNLLNPSNYQGMAQQMGNQAMQGARERAGYANGLFGANSAAAKGAWTQGLNQATGAQNSFLSNLYSPQNRGQMISQGLGVIGQAQNPSSLSAFGNLAGLVYGQPHVQVGQGLGSFLGQAAGSLFGGGAGAFSSGSGGSGAPSYSFGGGMNWGNVGTPNGGWGKSNPSSWAGF